MLISHQKAVGVFKPWWNVFYGQSLFAGIGLSLLLLILSSGEEKRIIVQENEGKIGNANDTTEAGNNVAQEEERSQINDTASAEEGIDNLIRKMSLFTDPTSFNTQITTRTTKTTSYEKFGMIFSLYMLVLFCSMYLTEIAFNRLFYCNHVLQTMCHILEYLSDLRQFRWSENARVFNSTLHHSHSRNYLRWMFDLHNWFRLAVVLIAFIISMHEYFRPTVMPTQESLTSLGIFLILLLTSQLIFLTFGTFWPWIFSFTSTWGRLMIAYTNAVNQIDITRGRCVPKPPFRKRSAQRVLDNLNPYSASDDLKLILDLIAYRSGLGLALKCLSGLELDVHNNWQPSRISIKKTDRALEVSWKDPLAILYLMPLPEDLNMHFGVDICFKSISDRERLIRIVGYDERRYYQRVWHSSRPSSVEVKMTESFSYNETFEEIDDFEDIARVDVWTIVDGHMIAKTSGAIEAGPPNAIPKPPRIHSPKSSQQEPMSATVRTDSADREDSNCECHEVEESCDKLDCSRRLQNDLVLTGSESSLSRDSVSDGSKNNRLSTTSSSSPPARRGGGGEFKTTRSLTNILDEGGHQGDPQVHKLMKKSVSQGNKLQQVNNSFKKKTKRSVLRQDDERKDKAGYNNYAFEEDIDAEGTRGDRHILI